VGLQGLLALVLCTVLALPVKDVLNQEINFVPRHALNQQWAIRFLGLPTIGLFIMTVIVFGIMYKHYYTHDEVSYEATLR